MICGKMSKKTCDAFFCTKRVPAKYRYCYDCAKAKGHIGNNGIGLFGWVFIIFVVWVIFG